jgi:hypothetical protein
MFSNETSSHDRSRLGRGYFVHDQTRLHSCANSLIVLLMFCCNSNGNVYHYAHRKVIPNVAIPVECLWNYVYQKSLILVP